MGLLLENCRGASHAPVRRVGAKWQAPRANAVQHGGRTGHAREDVGTFAGLGAGFSILSGRDTFNRGGRSALNTVNTTLTKDQLDQITGFFMTGNGPYFISPSVIGLDGRGVAPDGAIPFTAQQALMPVITGVARQVFFNPDPGTLGSLQRRWFSGPWNFSWDMAAPQK